MMDLLMKYWPMAIIALATLSIAFTAVYHFFKYPAAEKIATVKAWLLAAVTAAQKQFGAGTGSIKLSYVYNQFLQTFPQISSLISFDKFSELVDEVLDKFRGMLQSNKNLQDYINE